MLEILWPVVDSQLAGSDPLPEPPGPASGPACTGRAKVVTGYPKRLLPNACTTPAQALIDIAGLPPAHTLGRRNGMHIPSSRPAQAGLRPTLKSTLQRSAPHPARGAVKPLADPVWALPSGDVFAAAAEPRQSRSPRIRSGRPASDLHYAHIQSAGCRARLRAGPPRG